MGYYVINAGVIMVPEPFQKSDYIELYNRLVPFKDYFEDKGYTFPRTDSLVPRDKKKASIAVYARVILVMGSELSANLAIASGDDHHLNALSGIFDEYYYERC